ncbi:MAG TPA: outer membrane beta-barrel protein [Vicinamibacterales bacterium]
MKSRVLIMVLGLGLASAGTARADWLLTPFLGTTFGGATDGQHVTYGASFGYMGARVVGFEVDFGYAPELFDTDDDDFDLLGDSNLTTLMGNVIVGIPIGEERGARPYVVGGAGLIRTFVADAGDFFEISNSDFGVNVGGGVMGFITENVGLRGDIRYFRSLEDPEEDNEFDIDFGDFDFWRASFGVTFRF